MKFLSVSQEKQKVQGSLWNANSDDYYINIGVPLEIEGLSYKELLYFWNYYENGLEEESHKHYKVTYE